MARIAVKKPVKVKAKARPRPRKVSARAIAKKRSSVSFHMVRKSRARKQRPQTGIEAIVEGWLTEANVLFKSEHAISRTHVDFFVPDARGLTKGTIIEVQGCYFHGCNCRSEDKPLTKDQMKRRRRDGRRFTFFRNAGFELLLLWEHEINGEPEKTRQKLLKAITK